MPTFQVTDPDSGLTLRLTGDSPPTESELEALFAQNQPEVSAADQALGFADAALTVGSAALAEPISGLAGIAQTLNPFAEEGAGAQAAEDVARLITFDPSTEEGRNQLKSLSKTLQPLTELLEKAEKVSGDVGFDLLGPIGGAIGASLPTAFLEGLGLASARKVAKAGSDIKEIAKAVPDEKATAIIEGAEELDIPILTSDVSPPETFAGKSVQKISEKSGVLGTGSARQSQQIAREESIINLAEEGGIELDSPFAKQVVDSLNTKSKKVLQEATDQRAKAVNVLDDFGNVPMTKAFNVIDEKLRQQESLGARANAQILQRLRDTKSALETGSFSHAKNIRSEVIADLIDVRKGDDIARAEPVYQAVKSAIDQDMVAFARKHDKNAAADWLRSNRKFAAELDNTKRTELKRILNSGDATPEKVMPLLRGGKPSELNRLHGALTEKGRSSARSAILQDALKESKFFEVDANPNPNAFATALNKPNRQQAINVFFKGDEKKSIDAMARVLQATRRAQDASLSTATGQELLPILGAGGIGAAATAAPLTTVSTVTALSAAAKIYESNAFRSLLLKISNAKKGSKTETGLLEQAATVFVAELQADKEAQEQTSKEQ